MRIIILVKKRNKDYIIEEIDTIYIISKEKDPLLIDLIDSFSILNSKVKRVRVP